MCGVYVCVVWYVWCVYVCVCDVVCVCLWCGVCVCVIADFSILHWRASSTTAPEVAVLVRRRLDDLTQSSARPSSPEPQEMQNNAWLMNGRMQTGYLPGHSGKRYSSVECVWFCCWGCWNGPVKSILSVHGLEDSASRTIFHSVTVTRSLSFHPCYGVS